MDLRCTRRRCDSAGYQCVVHCGARPDGNWDTMVRTTSKHRLTHLTFIQALHLCDRHGITDDSVPHHNTHPRLSAPTDTRWHSAGCVHTVRPMADSVDRNGHTTLRPFRKRQLELQYLRYRQAVRGSVCRDFGVVDAE